MGFDVSYHPISTQEMEQWYFRPLQWMWEGKQEKIRELAAQYEMDEFYVQKYETTLQVAASTQPEELFDKSHGYYLAVVQGFFQTFYYTRGSAFTFLMEEKPAYCRYTTSWEDVVPYAFPNKMQNKIVENYCAGVFLAPAQVIQLLNDLEHNVEVQADFAGVYSHGRLKVLQKALGAARDKGVGLLEATEVVEPNPMNPNSSGCYSNLHHCDTDGVYLYIDAAMEQLGAAMKEE